MQLSSIPRQAGAARVRGVTALPQRRSLVISNVAAPLDVASPGPAVPENARPELAEDPPFTLRDIRASIPNKFFERPALKSFGYLVRDVAIVLGLAAATAAIDQWWAWPVYWFAQSTMFWALFVVGHDCGHQSFSQSRAFNDFVGNIVHSSIMVPYHGWRISHRKHHQNHGHVENDESWHPFTESRYKGSFKNNIIYKAARYLPPFNLLIYPIYLLNPNHYDPNGELFTKEEKKMVMSSNLFQLAWVGLLGAFAYFTSPMALLSLYVVPYLGFVMWLDIVTYLHHHGTDESMPWYRGEEWSYLRGGLTTIDRDFGIFNGIHHNIETHVLHHLFPSIPHYNLVEATEHAKVVMGPYYREPEKSKGWFPTHLFGHLFKSFKEDHYVADTGDVVYYQKDPTF